MINVIVPIDFSETSLNAARYCVNMYADKTEVNMILYHFYKSGDDDIETNLNYLNSLKNEYAAQIANIEILQESGNEFIESLAAFAHVKQGFMIVMGLTGKSAVEQVFSGSNTLKIAEKDVCPVLVVPAHCTFNNLQNVLIASEMKDVEETPVILAVKRVLAFLKPKVHVLNVDNSHYISLTEAYKLERDKMEVILQEFSPEFYFMRQFDFHESMNRFVEDKNIDMIIMGPKHHSIFDIMFKTQHTKKMLYQSEVPMLLIHE